MKKKLNKKGFTLVELLAVIVVLAIILVITVPMVLNSISSTRQDALQASANSVAKFYEEQLSLNTLGKGNSFIFDSGCTGGSSSTACAKFNDTSSSYEAYGTVNSSTGKCTSGFTLNKETNTALGLNNTDYNLASSYVCWDTNGSVTVTLKGNDDSKSKFNGLEATSDN